MVTSPQPDSLKRAKPVPSCKPVAADLLLQEFDFLADTPDAVPTLRALVLALAVEGRLVPQSPKDEPASKLLAAIAAEKQRFVSERHSGRATPRGYNIAGISDHARPPGGWVWTTLGQVSLRIHYGYTASADHASRDIRLLRITDIQDNQVDWNSVPGCAIDGSDVAKYQLAAGDILIARTGGTIGKTFLVETEPPRAVFASYLIRVIPSKLVSAHAKTNSGLTLGRECNSS
jgi:type I restriction enzyme S subunit